MLFRRDFLLYHGHAGLWVSPVLSAGEVVKYAERLRLRWWLATTISRNAIASAISAEPRLRLKIKFRDCFLLAIRIFLSLLAWRLS